MLKLISVLALMFSFSINSFAEETVVSTGGKQVLTCTGNISGMDLQLEFYKLPEVSEAEKLNGYWIQNMGPIGAFPAAGLKISETETAKTFELSVMDAPDVMFAKFEIPSQEKEMTVDILAVRMGNALWGTFRCQVVE